MHAIQSMLFEEEKQKRMSTLENVNMDYLLLLLLRKGIEMQITFIFSYLQAWQVGLKGVMVMRNPLPQSDEDEKCTES